MADVNNSLLQNMTAETQYKLDVATLVSMIHVYIDFLKDKEKQSYSDAKKLVEEVVRKMDDDKIIVVGTFLPQVADVLSNAYSTTTYPDKLKNYLIESVVDQSLFEGFSDDIVKRALNDLKDLALKAKEARDVIVSSLLQHVSKEASVRFSKYFPMNFLRALSSDEDTNQLYQSFN